MLNILVNDSSFSTLGGEGKGGKKKKGKGKGKDKKAKSKKNVAKQMGFTAEEIL